MILFGDNDIANAILYYCEQNGVDPLLATATFETESGFNQVAISSSGAIGITQLMPSTALLMDLIHIINMKILKQVFVI